MNYPLTARTNEIRPYRLTAILLMNNNYTIAEQYGVKYVTFPAMEKTGMVKCAFTTRIGGVSPAPYDTLNLGFTTDDKSENVKENRNRFTQIIPEAFARPILQIHENNVIKIEQKRGQTPFLNPIEVNSLDPSLKKVSVPFFAPQHLQCADALVTNLANTPITVLVADCFVIYILDPVKKAIGLAHCGWRGSVKNIILSVIKKMAAEYDTAPANCLAAVSPGIGPCCFLTDEDVYAEFKNAYPEWGDLYKNVGACHGMPLQKYSVDLAKINFRLLAQAGIKEENISTANLCTTCRKDLFYSYRRDNKDTGRMAGTIVLI